MAGPLLWVQDSLRNLLSSLGTSKDKTTYAQYVLNVLNREQLESAYRGDWVAAKAVDIPAWDETREWRAWQAENDQIEAIEEVERKFGIQQKVMAARICARLYGGAALILGVKQGTAADELNPDTLGKDTLQFVHVIPAHDITNGELEKSVLSPNFGLPQWYEVRNDESMSRIHPSRVVRFVGTPLPDINMQAINPGWGDPILQRVDDAVRALGICQQGIVGLLQETKIDVVNVPGLSETLANEDDARKLTDRFTLANMAKSSTNMLLLDENEKWQRINASFQSLPEILQQYMVLAAGANDIPATRFIGQSPAGLSATGESDMRNYYDRIKAGQNMVLRPQMSPLDEVTIRSALGSRPKEIHYVWNSLWQMTPKEKAELSKSKADTYSIDVNTGLIPDEALAKARANQLIEDGVYPGLEKALEESVQKLGEPSPEQKAALIAQGVHPVTGEPIAPPKGAANDNPAPNDLAKQNQRQKKLAGDARFTDAKPRTLYVRRDLQNAGEFIRWAKSQGFTDIEAAADLHVTIAYSTEAVDWMKVEGDYYAPSDTKGTGELIVPEGGPRLVEALGDAGAIVLLFSSTSLQWRHEQIKRDTGATWDYDEFQPHVTITYKGAPPNLDKVVPYRGKLIFGPEIFEEVTP
jgi:phage-related protein (TIGR01555 family)